MGRSVSVPSDSLLTLYLDTSWVGKTDNDGEYDEVIAEFDWEDFKTNLIESLKSIAPSLEVVKDEWLDRETIILMENGLVQVTLSEYCGLASVAFIPQTDLYGDYLHYGLSAHWLDQKKEAFSLIGEYNKIGSFSNGESVYEKRGV